MFFLTCRDDVSEFVSVAPRQDNHETVVHQYLNVAVFMGSAKIIEHLVLTCEDFTADDSVDLISLACRLGNLESVRALARHPKSTFPTMLLKTMIIVMPKKYVLGETCKYD